MEPVFNTISATEALAFDGRYKICANGEVYSCMGFGMHKEKMPSWHPVTPRVHTNGYLRIGVKDKDYYVHRLVAAAFCPNPRGLKEVNHIDGNKRNNAASNLEWCTRSENNRHAFKTGLRSYAELSRMAQRPNYEKRKFTPEQIRQIRKLCETKGVCEVARIYGVRHEAIRSIKNRKTYKEIV